MFPLSLSMLLVTAQPVLDPLYQAWPINVPGKVLYTPDWSDYRIYPPAAVDLNEEGSVGAELLVGPDGLPKACRITATSNFPELDGGTCDLLMTMRFEPATDPAGRPVSSHLVKNIGWRLTDQLPFGSSSITFRTRIEHGQQTSCAMASGQGSFADLWAHTGCSFLRDVPYFFGAHAQEKGDATVEVRLDTASGPPATTTGWPAGTPVASEKISFSINDNGDVVNCVALQQYGFGSRGLNNLSPCSRFLASLWISTADLPAPARHGTIETRVYLKRR